MKDHRLDLGRYITNPFNKRGDIGTNLDFGDLFRSKSKQGDYPWNPSRFTTADLTKRAQSRKLNLNNDLNFVENSPFFDENPDETNEKYEMFEGIGRFARGENYSFEEGRPNTIQRPQEQPDFDPRWVEAYKFSPTINPDESIENPMPRMTNPDPNGYLQQIAEKKANEDFGQGEPDIEQLLKRKQEGQTAKQEEAEGEEVIEGEE
tara:strand:+ start:289 stop:906 length:618 start_codon:yes stop_codon:yes gene_type:complete